MSDQTSELPSRQDGAPSTSPEITAPIPVRDRGLRPSQVALVFVAVAAASFLVGIVASLLTQPRSDEDVIAEADVGPAGRTVRFDGGQITFPEGATRRTLHVVVRRSMVDQRVRVGRGSEGVIVEPGELAAYRFEPVDATFRRDVEITFRLPARSRNGTAFARRGEDVILLQGTVDPARSTATVTVRDFRFDG